MNRKSGGCGVLWHEGGLVNQLCMFDTEGESKWIIDIDNGMQLLRCEKCGGRVIRRWYDLAVGDQGFQFCPYCGKHMINAEAMIVPWPGYREETRREVKA